MVFIGFIGFIVNRFRRLIGMGGGGGGRERGGGGGSGGEGGRRGGGGEADLFL